MMIFWLTCLVGYPQTSAPEPKYQIFVGGSSTEAAKNVIEVKVK